MDVDNDFPLMIESAREKKDGEYIEEEEQHDE